MIWPLFELVDATIWTTLLAVSWGIINFGSRKSSKSTVNNNIENKKYTSIRDERVGVGEGIVAVQGSRQEIDQSENDNRVTNIDIQETTHNTVTDHGATESAADIARESVRANERTSLGAIDEVGDLSRFAIDSNVETSFRAIDSVEDTSRAAIDEVSYASRYALDANVDTTRKAIDSNLEVTQSALEENRRVQDNAFNFGDRASARTYNLALDSIDQSGEFAERSLELADDISRRSVDTLDLGFDAADQTLARALAFADTVQSDAIHQTSEALERGFASVADLTVQKSETEGQRSAKSLQYAILAGAAILIFVLKR